MSSIATLENSLMSSCDSHVKDIRKEESSSSNEVIKDCNNGETSSSSAVDIPSRKNCSSKQRNYVLNDVGALKKKVGHEKRTHDIIISKEAKDFSNVIIIMRASFFEYVKANFILELENNPFIIKIENAEGVKAVTETCGDAFVEYSLEITFSHQDNSHTVKLTAYTTTSQIMIQPLHEKPGIRDHLGKKGTPRFFAETFLMSWSDKVIKENKLGLSWAKLSRNVG